MHQRVRLVDFGLGIHLDTDPRGPSGRLRYFLIRMYCLCAFTSEVRYLAIYCAGLKSKAMSLTINSAAFHIHTVAFEHQEIAFVTHVSTKLYVRLALIESSG
jgi:hypothetical protein